SRAGLLSAKTLNVLGFELFQAIVIVATGIALGWNPSGGLFAAIGLLLLGTIAFAGIGMLIAGTLRAEANLAIANGLFLVLLFLGGMAYPLHKLPDALETFAKGLPAAALSETLRGVLDPRMAFPTGELVVLVIWAIAAPRGAAQGFRGGEWAGASSGPWEVAGWAVDEPVGETRCEPLNARYVAVGERARGLGGARLRGEIGGDCGRHLFQ